MFKTFPSLKINLSNKCITNTNIILKALRKSMKNLSDYKEEISSKYILI